MTTTKTLTSKIAVVLLGIALVIGASYAHAAFFEPAGLPPDRNMLIPINVTAVDQAKEGGLSVNTFIAAQDAAFHQQTFIGGIVRGGTPSDKNSTVGIGGVDDGTLQSVDTLIEGAVDAKTLASPTLRNSTMRKICADEEGRIKLCFYGYATADVWTWQNSSSTNGVLSVPPGTNAFGGGSFAIWPVPGYNFIATACIPLQFTTNRTATVKWTDPNTGQHYQTTVTVPQDQECTYWFNGVSVSGPSTGTGVPVTDVCIIPNNPLVLPDPSQQC